MIVVAHASDLHFASSLAVDRAIFAESHGPGDRVERSGIYRCAGCRLLIVSNEGDPFPPQDHHQHPRDEGEIRWQLRAWSVNAPDEPRIRRRPTW